MIRILSLSLSLGIKRGFFDDGFGNFVGKFVEVFQVLVSVGCISCCSAAATRCSVVSVCRGLTAFFHHSTPNSLCRSKYLSLSR